MVGLIGNLAKGALTKPKQKKVNPQNLIQASSDKKEQSKPKGTLVPSPSGAIVKIIDVKAPVKKDFITGGDPALEQMNVINTKTFDIIKALKGQQDAKKKRAKSKKNLFQWMSRKNREEGREEEKGGGLKIPLVGKIAAGAGNLLGAILKTLAILFAGWLTKYLPQIIETVRKFVDIVGKILNFVKPIAILLFDIGKWIVTNGTKLAAKLVGVDPKITEENSIIQNLNEIQKRFPLLEAAFAAFLVYKGTGGIRTLRKPRGKPNIKPKTSKVSGTQSNIKTSSKTSNLVRTKHGTSAQRIFDNAIDNGKSAASANAEVQRALKSGKITSKPDFGLSSKGKEAGKVLKGGPIRSIRRMGIKTLGRTKSLGLARFGTKVAKLAKLPVIGGLIVAVTQLLSGEPLGKALFMGIGAGLGGIIGGLIGAAGGPLAIAGAIVGELLGTFVGELLYEGFMGKGWGAAGEKLMQALKGIWEGMIKPLGTWLKGVFSTFIEKFKAAPVNKLPFGATNWINILNPLITAPLLFKSFFGPPKDDGVKRNILGIEMKDQRDGSSDVDVEQTTDAGDLEFTGTSDTQSSKADSIGTSASYDKVEGGDTTIITNGGGAIPSGGGGGSSLSLVGGSDFYRAAQLNRKKSNLAQVWA